ncbi:hypothetical protein [Ruminococcus flavefaciens]|uniref:Uncharacterized protein n=1 Tax=Ruminococcus flavefaciens TaxID=1265 RepID=A0A1K1LJC6_RUMFL|nr:hypothetical protein [Ruminococcus flavefaciens]SFW10984.1 hypothetical protein SAMN02910280_0441 [Ruminococcus flavefaciens]
MNIKFNIEKSERKALAQKIGELAEMDVRYCGVPSCAYEIGFFTLSKDAVLSFADRMDTEVIEKVLDGLDKAGYTSEDEPETLTISMPRDFFTEQSMNNLLQLIANKETLLKHLEDQILDWESDGIRVDAQDLEDYCANGDI